MWRIHLTAQDLARVRLAPAADPRSELLLSLRIAGGTSGEEVFGRWRRACRRRFGGVLDRLSDLSAGELRSTYFDHAVAPYWPVIHRHVVEDLLHRRASLADGGLGGLFESLSPWVGWDGTTLVLLLTTGDRELRSDGHGLVLQPSFFLYDELIVLRRADAPLLVMYPVSQRRGWFSSPSSAASPLEAVLGRTRSQILETVAVEVCSTTDVARRVGISLPAASQQLARLRAAGLVTSTPHGKQVIHVLTALGRDLWATRACGSSEGHAVVAAGHRH